MSDIVWKRAAIVQYFDARDSVIGDAAAALSQLAPADKTAALNEVSETVVAQVARLDDTALAHFAVSVADDLYRMISIVEIWLPEADDYVMAAHGAFFAALSARGFRLRFVIENTIPDHLQRVRELFPRAFRQAGLAFVCPQLLALDLAIAEGALDKETVATVADVAPWRVPAHAIAEQLVTRVDAAGFHLVYFEADYEDDDLDAVTRQPPPPGAILVVRTEAPVPGSAVRVHMTPPKRGGAT